MVSLWRTLHNIQRAGLKQSWRNIFYIGDAKFGQLVGQDQFGNRYFQNYNATEEVPGRQRWVDYAQHDVNGSQVPPEWHSWLVHIRGDAPTNDAVIKAVTPPWQAPYRENLTGTPAAYRPYNTVVPKINAWVPTTQPRAPSS